MDQVKVKALFEQMDSRQGLAATNQMSCCQITPLMVCVQGCTFGHSQCDYCSAVTHQASDIAVQQPRTTTATRSSTNLSFGISLRSLVLGCCLALRRLQAVIVSNQRPKHRPRLLRGSVEGFVFVCPLSTFRC